MQTQSNQRATASAARGEGPGQRRGKPATAGQAISPSRR